VILQFNVFINSLNEVLNVGDAHVLENTLKDHFETFKVPVLIDDSVDNMRSENLLGFASK